MPEDFGHFITTRRRELELTLGDVATRLDVSPITVSNWSNGQSTPEAEQLEALATLLDVPIADLSSIAGLPAEPAAETVDDAGEEATPAVEVVPEDVPEVEVVPEDESGSPDAEAADADIDDELAEIIDEASAEEAAVEAVPDSEPEDKEEVPAAATPAAPTVEAPPARKRSPARRAKAAAATATTERPPVVLPITYIEDPKQLMRYRIRWGLTIIALGIMFFILIWAAGGLISALSDIKESVTPGGGS